MQALFDEIKEWTVGYIAGYNNSDTKIQAMMDLKNLHTDYVVENSELLAHELGFNSHDIILAKLIGLLHDIGRFEQYTRYQTFNDRLSENHAKLGLSVLAKEGILDRLTAADREILVFAIVNHNARTIEPEADEHKLVFAKLIRDADKLDIYRVLEPMTEPSDGSGYSEGIMQCLLDGQQCDYTYIKTYDDRKLVRLLWLYDIYFSWTMRKIVERGYVENIVNKLPQNEQISVGIERLERYIQEKMLKKD